MKGSQRLCSNRRAHNVHQRVHRAHFVKMNFLDRHIVDFRLRRAEFLEEANARVTRTLQSMLDALRRDQSGRRVRTA